MARKNEAALEKVRQDFESSEGYWERRRGIFMFRRWAELVGDYPTVTAVDRFLKFCDGAEHHAA